MSKGRTEASTPQQALAIVSRALELCRERSGWTKRVFARDRHSHPVPVMSERAVRFCLTGALIRAAAEELNLLLFVAAASEPRPADGPISEGPPALQQALRVCGEQITRSLAAAGAKVEVEGELVTVTLSNKHTLGPASWGDFLTSCNDHLRHGQVVNVLRAAEAELAAKVSRTQRRTGRGAKS